MIVHAKTPEQSDQLVRYLAGKIGEEPQALIGSSPFHIMASVRDGKLLGAVLFLNYRRHSMEFHLCGGPGWVTRSEIRELFSYPFEFVGCLRLWCLIRRNNKTARKGAERLGFKVKCVLDDEFGDGKDAVLYSMKRSECRWLR